MRYLISYSVLMSDVFKTYIAAEDDVRELIKRKARLDVLKRLGKLSEEDKIELEGVTELLSETRHNKEFWRELVSRETRFNRK